MDQDPRAKQNDELYRQWRDARSEWDTEARKDIEKNFIVNIKNQKQVY